MQTRTAGANERKGQWAPQSALLRGKRDGLERVPHVKEVLMEAAVEEAGTALELPDAKRLKYLAVKGPSFEYNDVATFQRRYFSLAARLLLMAVLTGRRAVAPAVPCSSKWSRGYLDLPEGLKLPPAERNWTNGLQTAKCKYRPGPEAGPEEVCCYPWIRTHNFRCGLITSMIELEYALSASPEVAARAKVISLEKGLAKAEDFDSDATVIYLQLTEDRMPLMDLTPEELAKVRRSLKAGSCDLLHNMLKEDYLGLY
eukprot:1616872-Pyramimonas_sp.AAC.2